MFQPKSSILTRTITEVKYHLICSVIPFQNTEDLFSTCQDALEDIVQVNITGFSVQSLSFLSWAWTQLYFRHLNVSSKRKEKERIVSLPTARVQILYTASRKRYLKGFKRTIQFTSPKLFYSSLNTQGPIGSGRCQHLFFIQQLCPFSVKQLLTEQKCHQEASC